MTALYLCRCTKENEHDSGKRLAGIALKKTFSLSSKLAHDGCGKPYFIGVPNISVSISHSEGLCLAAVSDSEIGADTEYMDISDPARLIRISQRYFTEDEQKYVLEAPEKHFYEIWCAKESYMKYIGKGFSCPMPSFSVLSGELYFSHRIYGDHMIAVCSGSAAAVEHVIINTVNITL